LGNLRGTPGTNAELEQTMKIIKEGNKQPQTFRGDCSICGSTYEADRSELKIEDGGQREPGEFAHANCAICRKRGQGNGYLILYPVS
jgi:hypothetical protein